MEANIKELNRPEMEKVAGGDVIDQFKCLIAGHDWVFVAENDNDIKAFKIQKSKCRCCGKIMYQWVDRRGNASVAYESGWNEYN